MSGVYWFQVHGDLHNGCELHLYCDAALVHRHYFHGWNARDLANAAGLHWMMAVPPDGDPLSAATGYQKP